jgi:hypothetical protein
VSVTETAAPPAHVCSACGSPYEPGQEYCLDCGSRLLPPSPFHGWRLAWEARFGRYPGDWVWPALLALLVAAGAAAAAIVVSDAGSSGTARTIVATTALAPLPPPPVAVTTTPLPPAAPPPRAPRQPTQPTQPTPRSLIDWPGQNGYTIVLVSVPANQAGLKEARSKATAALEAGLPKVGFLKSDGYASLHPGYYVVFSGVYESLDDAQVAVSRLQDRYPNAYAREIAR